MGYRGITPSAQASRIMTELKLACYECGTSEDVFSWNLGPSQAVVPLCGPCRKQCAHVFLVLEQAQMSKQENLKKNLEKRGLLDRIAVPLVVITIIIATIIFILMGVIHGA